MSIPKYRKILYATDLGDHMRPVFRHALSLAKQYKAQVVMLHAIEPLGASGEAVLEAYLPKRADKLREEALKKTLKLMKKRLQAFYQDELEELGEKPKLVSEVVVASGHPVDEICKTADDENADLIVIGTHTEGGFGHGLLGSTARKLVHVSKRPVLVVPVKRD